MIYFDCFFQNAGAIAVAAISNCGAVNNRLDVLQVLFQCSIRFGSLSHSPDEFSPSQLLQVTLSSQFIANYSMRHIDQGLKQGDSYSEISMKGRFSLHKTRSGYISSV